MNKALLAKRRKQLDSRAPKAIQCGGKVVARAVQSLTDGIAVIATENPVEQSYDGRMIRQVLLMSGCELRPGNHSLPIVDSHVDTTVHNIFGSVKDIVIRGSEMLGRPEFASDAEAQKIATRYAEGHITDFSITAKTIDGIELRGGQTYTTENGQVIEGPAIIFTRWIPINASICATGADDFSYVKRSVADQEIKRMDEALLSKLSAMGLPEGMTDPNQVLAWVVGKLGEEEMPEAESEMVENMEETTAEVPVEEVKPVVEKMDGEKKPEEEMVARRLNVEATIKRALEKDQARRKEIQAACKLAGIERAYADELCDGQVSLSEARKRIIERMATKPSGSSVGADVRVTGDGNERLYKAIGDGLIARSHRSAGIQRKPGIETDEFAHIPLKRAAELIVRRCYNVNTDMMLEADIAKLAMGNKSVMRKYNVERAYHTTGSFANLLLDAANKTLLAAYEEATPTWNLWARQAPSVPDFKNINRIRFSESPDPEMVPEKQEYKEKAMSDSKETYKVEKYGALFTVSWETVVNDDLDAISRVPAMHGNACRRKVNREVYSVLTSNPTMGDSVTLFGAHASGSNVSGASANPSVTTLNAAYAAMRVQKGLTADAIISVIPRFLIVPAALEATALELVNSTSYIVANGNQGVQNIYGVGGVRSLTVIGEPVLDGNSTTAWYLAADPAQVDTVEVSFLQGEESPVLEDEWDFDKDVYKYKVRQTFGVKAIDWRGLYKYAVS